MSEKQKQMIESMAESVKKMDPVEQGYIAGYATAKAEEAEAKKEKQE